MLWKGNAQIGASLTDCETEQTEDLKKYQLLTYLLGDNLKITAVR